MSISLSPLFTELNTNCLSVQSFKSELNKLESERDLIVRLDQEVRAELREKDTFNWELKADKKALLDQIYDLDLLADIEERIYAFTDTERLMAFMQNIKSALESKSSDVQNQHQYHAQQKDELMRFYQNLLEIISKLANIVASIAQRI